MKAKKAGALALAFALLMTLCSCWEEEHGEEFYDTDLMAEQGDETSAPEISEFSDFALPYLSNQSLDPITCPDGIQQTLSPLLYEGLFELDETYTVHNVLCESYDYDAESFTYSFTLRSSVSFSDGSSLTLRDVLAVYQRAAASERYSARFTNVASMRIVNNALIIRLSRANSAFPALLDIPITKLGSEKDTVPLGTGPYLFITDSDGPCLMRNTDWWQNRTLPLERITLIGTKDNDTSSYLFSSYEIHLLVSDLTGTERTPVSAETDITDCAGNTMLYLGFNTLRSPLSDAAVRRALSGTIDRTQIMTALLAGHAEKAYYPISPRSPLSPQEAPAVQSDLAAALDALGCSAKKPQKMSVLVNEENSFKVSIASYLAQQLSSAALELSVRALPWEQYQSALQSGGFDLYIGEIRLTADWDTSSLIGTYGANNYGYFSDAALDAALASFMAAQSETTARIFFQQFAQQAPIAPIAFKSVSVMTGKGLVESLTPTASNPFYGLDAWQLHLSK